MRLTLSNTRNGPQRSSLHWYPSEDQTTATSQQTLEVTCRSSPVAQPRYSRVLQTDDVMAPRLSQSLDAIKRLVEGYDDVAVQWAQVATETRQFSADIASLQPTPNGARPSCIPTRWPSPQQQRAPLVPFPSYQLR